jgi:NAD(P)-dependent dehydrogenase (short-subunit alcohol dehydrogenase family)
VDVGGRVALVTGAAAGIGRAIAERLAAEGVQVVIADIDAERGAAAARAIASKGATAAFVQADVSVADDVRRMIEFAVARYGGLDILVNNAGFAIDPPFPDAAAEDWRRLLEVNVIGLMHATQLALDVMRRRGGGTIVNVSSVAGLGLEPYRSPDYGAAKAAVVRLSASLAWLAERDSVRVNAICPDWVATEAVLAAREKVSDEEWRASGAPADLVPPQRVADAVLKLVGDDSLAGRVMACPHDGPWRLLPREPATRTSRESA